mmetsp:Transcript_33274/g.58381  ORF Transcript_33274/g.58381 Transcript_33274/m.58381 type:complete len:331 (-) Transcript_33274:310-1302(-)
MTEDYSPPKRRATFISTSTVRILREKSGILFKKSPKILVGWQRRFFVLKDKKLYYYAHDQAQKPKGIINFDLVTVNLVTEETDRGPRILLCPLDCKRRFKLKAQTADDHADWVSVLYEHITFSEGNRMPIPSVIGKCWWRFDRISVKQFESTAVTGDLLLFRSFNIAARVQRLFTRATYDHVAMILRYTDGELGLLEATQDYGVNIVMWDHFLLNNWQCLYSRLVLRHLETERSDEFVENLEKFISSNRNKAYGLNPIKLLNRTIITPGEESTFFCSQLVASAYMHLNLMSTDKPANMFWPGDFSSDKKLPMVNGAFLGEELCIDFSITG